MSGKGYSYTLESPQKKSENRPRNPKFDVQKCSMITKMLLSLGRLPRSWKRAVSRRFHGDAARGGVRGGVRVRDVEVLARIRRVREADARGHLDVQDIGDAVPRVGVGDGHDASCGVLEAERPMLSPEAVGHAAGARSCLPGHVRQPGWHCARHLPGMPPWC